MKKILILGGAGMAGHMITRYLKQFEDKYQIYTTARNMKSIYPDYYIDIEINKELTKLKKIIKTKHFDIVINCIGLLLPQCKNHLSKAIYINSFFPHWLEDITKDTAIKIIHLSTDCVFLGEKVEGYTEMDTPDEINNYGRCKAFGEIKNEKDLTLRLSIIGSELKINGSGLFHWFMKQKDEVGGYSKCYWNGITTFELAKQINKIINLDCNLTGLYQLAPDFKISKFDLLKKIATIFNKKIIIKANDSMIQNKTLLNGRKDEYYPQIPNYDVQLEEMRDFTEEYE